MNGEFLTNIWIAISSCVRNSNGDIDMGIFWTALSAIGTILLSWLTYSQGKKINLISNAPQVVPITKERVAISEVSPGNKCDFSTCTDLQNDKYAESRLMAFFPIKCCGAVLPHNIQIKKVEYSRNIGLKDEVIIESTVKQHSFKRLNNCGDYFEFGIVFSCDNTGLFLCKDFCVEIEAVVISADDVAVDFFFKYDFKSNGPDLPDIFSCFGNVTSTPYRYKGGPNT